MTYTSLQFATSLIWEIPQRTHEIRVQTSADEGWNSAMESGCHCISHRVQTHVLLVNSYGNHRFLFFQFHLFSRRGATPPLAYIFYCSSINEERRGSDRIFRDPLSTPCPQASSFSSSRVRSPPRGNRPRSLTLLGSQAQRWLVLRAVESASNVGQQYAIPEQSTDPIGSTLLCSWLQCWLLFLPSVGIEPEKKSRAARTSDCTGDSWL